MEIYDANRQAKKLVDTQFKALPHMASLVKGMIPVVATSGKRNFGHKKLNRWDIDQAMQALIKFLNDYPHLVIGQPQDLSNLKRVTNPNHVRNNALMWVEDAMDVEEGGNIVKSYDTATIASVMFDVYNSSALYAVLDTGITVTKHAAERLLTRIPRDLLDIKQFLQFNSTAFDALLLVYPTMMAALMLRVAEVRLPTSSGLFLGEMVRRSKVDNENDGVLIRFSRKGVYQPILFSGLISMVVNKLRSSGSKLGAQFDAGDTLAFMVSTFVDSDMLSTQQEKLRLTQLQFIEQHRDVLIRIFMGFTWPEFNPSFGSGDSALLFAAYNDEFAKIYDLYGDLMLEHRQEFDF